MAGTSGKLILFAFMTITAAAPAAEPYRAPVESPAERTTRLQRVAQRRKGVQIITHRGASEFAHENTLEAYRASLELGADGNEIDIRGTKDGVLVCFHDDMLDQLLEACGDVSDYTWEELQQFRFRRPGRFADECRIPTLEEVFELHRQYGGLMHLDIKRPKLDVAIAALLSRLEMWDHVIHCAREPGMAIVSDPRLKPAGSYKAGLYLDHSEVFPDKIAVALKLPGDGLIVDDPRGTILALGRKLGRVSPHAVAPQKVIPHQPAVTERTQAELLAALADDGDWMQVAESEAERLAAGHKIVARARAADELGLRKMASPEVFAALEDRAHRRSLHKQWEYHGLDGALALRSLILLRAPQAAEAARQALWRNDPALEPVVNPMYKNPPAWTDFRLKMVVFPALAHLPGAATEKICRDYLALSDDEASVLGPPLFEAAARTLLAVSPKTETALELMRHRLQVVQGRAILDCLAQNKEPWALAALEQGARHALAYQVPD